MMRAQYPGNDTQAAQHLHTVRDWLRYAVSRFEQARLWFGHGSDNAWDEAVHLVLYALHLPPERLEPFLDARLTNNEAEAVLTAIETRVNTRKPAAYLTGQAWLHGLSFRCDSRALVPRSLLVEAMHDSLGDWLAQMQWPLPNHWPGTVLDLCCGGASIAIHAAHTFDQAQITAADIDEQALQLARENINDYELDNQITLIQSDLGAALDTSRFDLILCNPPYVPDASVDALPPEYQHEPDRALRAGPEGMDVITRIITQAPNLLHNNGLLLLELGHEAQAFEQAFANLEFGWLEVTAGADMIVAVTREQLLAQ